MIYTWVQNIWVEPGSDIACPKEDTVDSYCLSFALQFCMEESVAGPSLANATDPT